MARNMYGATSADFTLTSGGRVVPGAELTLWTARTGGMQITDLLDVDSVACTDGDVRLDGCGRLLRPRTTTRMCIGPTPVRVAGGDRAGRHHRRPARFSVHRHVTTGTAGVAVRHVGGAGAEPDAPAGVNGVNTAAIQDDAVTLRRSPPTRSAHRVGR